MQVVVFLFTVTFRFVAIASFNSEKLSRLSWGSGEWRKHVGIIEGFV